MIRDLATLGVYTKDLENSAELFIRMWERCYDPDRRPLGDKAYKRFMFSGMPR